MAKAWVIEAYEGIDALKLVECAKEEPGPNDVRLNVEAFSLNWGDQNLMEDMYSFSFSSLPARIGIEAAGIVDAVGSNVDGIEVGDRYCTLPYFYDMRGTSAQSVLIDQQYVTKAPMGLSAVESASIWMQFLTAYFPVVEVAGAAPGKNILVPAATSTAGTAALQLGRLCGATMIGTTRSEGSRQYLLDQGADHVFVDKGGDLEGFLLDATDGVGVHASFDPVGGDFMDRYGNAMASGGKLFLYGLLAGQFGTPPIVAMFQKNLWFNAYSVFNYVQDAEACSRGTAYVHSAIADGKISPSIDRIFPMEGYVDAWHYMMGERTSRGKVVIDTTF
ncbi:MAG: zinc-binding dehydrogenase [Pseudomonadota bacterium]